jgi:hypothetical protein
MIYEVVLYGSDDQPVGKALVEAPSANEAHSVAIRLMKKQYPHIEPQKYNQTIAMEILYRTESD